MCSHKNRLNEAILMRTHSIPYQNKKENHPKLSTIMSAVMGFFVRESRTISKYAW